MGDTRVQWLWLLVCSLIMLESQCVLGENNNTQEDVKVDITILQSAVSKGAVCLDGSPPAYYYESGHGEGANNWIIYFRGGEWCYNVTDCLNRSKTLKGSSELAPKQLPFYGMLSKDITMNPDFYNWNRVVVWYCDGSSFTGDVEGVDPDTKLHFRGARIFLAMIEHFLEKGMKNAKNAILTGGSAGGLPAILYCDRFQALLPNSARVKCLADGSYFLHRKNDEKMQFMESVNEGLINLHGSAKVLPSSCTSKMKPSLCLFPQYIQQEVKTPLFLVNSMYDSFQINKTFPGYYESLSDNNCSATQLQSLRDFKLDFLNALPKQSNSSSRGMFINSCMFHAQIVNGFTWNACKLHNKSIAQAFGDWFFDRSPFQVIDNSDLPLNCMHLPSVTNYCT